MHISFQGCYYIEKKKISLRRRSVPGVQHIPSLSVSLSLSHSHDIRNYSALAWTEPARLGVLLPRSWVSDSNRGKLAVTEAGGLGSRHRASETILFRRVFARCQSRREVTSHYGCKKMQIRRNTVGVKWAFLHVGMDSHRRNVYTELQRGRCEIECCSAALSRRKLQE